MMIASRNPIVRLQHIRYEIEGISKALHGVDRSRYLGDYLLQRAAERALLIVSEATRSLPGELLARYPEVDWRGIVQLGNILRHEYPMVDSEVLWEINHAKTAGTPPGNRPYDQRTRWLTGPAD